MTLYRGIREFLVNDTYMWRQCSKIAHMLNISTAVLYHRLRNSMQAVSLILHSLYCIDTRKIFCRRGTEYSSTFRNRIDLLKRRYASTQ